LLSSARSKRASRPRTGWIPPALHRWNLLVAVLLCWIFIVVLLHLFFVSQRDGGVVLASNINDLPLSKTFVYLYLPTMIAVVFSVYIVWIDIDAKRFEPCRQLSKPGGALGKDSLLLHYPFDFLPMVPITAFRKR
jgi:hypothetical protein